MVEKKKEMTTDRLLKKVFCGEYARKMIKGKTEKDMVKMCYHIDLIIATIYIYSVMEKLGSPLSGQILYSCTRNSIKA